MQVSFWNQLRPPLHEILVFILISTVALWHWLITRQLAVMANWMEQARTSLGYSDAWLHNPWINWCFLILFWAVVGLVVYCFVWAATMMLSEFRNDLILYHDYTNRGNNTRHYQTVLQQIAIALITATLLIGLAWVYPKLYQVVSQATLASWQSGVEVLGATVVLAVWITLIWRMIRSIFWLPELEKYGQ